MGKFILHLKPLGELFQKQFLEILRKNDLPFEVIEVTPFDYEIISKNPLEGTDYLPYGSNGLTLEASKKGWRGCYFNLETFNYKTWNQERDDMLNGGEVLRISDAFYYLKNFDQNTRIFIRPSEDTKLFSGFTSTAFEVHNWLQNALEIASSKNALLKLDSEVLISEEKDILGEWRWFVVDGKVVDGSLYRSYGRILKKHEKDEDVIKEAQEFADKWLPHKNCVMDLCLVDDSMKVVEFNTINCSGFYMNDVEKIFLELWRDFKNDGS